MTKKTERPTFTVEELKKIEHMVMMLASAAYDHINKQLEAMEAAEDVKREILMETMANMTAAAVCQTFNVRADGVVEAVCELFNENLESKLNLVKNTPEGTYSER